jgi:ribosomal protein L37AE/L43A
MKNYHCCATCMHFKTERNETGITYKCSRLGYTTKPDYQFNCWNPRMDIQEKMKKNNS